MSAFKIGGLPSRPASEITGSKKLKTKESVQQSAEPSRSAFDAASVNPNRLAVMPRMSTITSIGVQQIKSEAVESVLRDSAAELDGLFTKAYGFEK